MEYIIIDNGVITKHGCSAQKPENALEVPSGFPGYVGLPFAALKDDLTGLKPLSQQVSEGIIDLPEGYKINADDNEFQRMEQSEIDTKYPPKTYALEGSFEAIDVKKMFDRDGNFGYWPPSGMVEMAGEQPGPAYKAVSGQWVLDTEKDAEVAMSEAKTDRAEAVARITVEVDGMVFDGDEKAQDRMARAITMFQASNLPDDYTTAWVLADNTVAQVTVNQLAQALLLAGQKQTELWTKPYEAVNAETE
nr:MAG TPA: protein of unknown function DUF4376 [Caudoviricetes sp.]